MSEIIVQDGGYMAKGIAMQLMQAGYTVKLCEQSELIDTVKADRPALLILDAALPDTEIPEMPDTPLLVIVRSRDAYLKTVLQRRGAYCISTLESVNILPTVRRILHT